MISWIIFIIGVLLSISLGYLCNVDTFDFLQILLIFIVALAILLVLNALCAIICCKLIPNKFFNQECKFFIPSKFEYRLYKKLGVKKWKDLTPEWGTLNGFSKSKVENPKDRTYIKKFILECNKGYLDHLVSLFVPAILILCVPKSLILTMALPMLITNFLLNAIPIVILRFNVERLLTLLRFVERKK